jgi:hypothetical protein
VKRESDSSGGALLLRARGCPGPWKELVEAIVRPEIDEADENIGKIGLGLDVVQLAGRRQGAHGPEHGLSPRRTCTLFKVARSALGYQGMQGTKDATVIARMRERSAQYSRYRAAAIAASASFSDATATVCPGRAYRLWRASYRAAARPRDRKRRAGRTGMVL